MPQAIFKFTPDFLWGTATAAHQVEGNNTNNNWAAWEAEPGRIIDGHRAGLACNWWGGRWKEDLDRAAETGQNAHRLSIEWSRIQPAPDRWDEHALNHYRMIIRGLLERKITPMVTLHHFTDPIWLVEQRGWENDALPLSFNTYVSKVVEALKEYVSLWITINEPNVYTYGGYLGGGFPPGKNDMAAAFIVMRNMVRAHAAAYQTIHRIQPNAMVGVASNYRSFHPAHSWFPPDIWMSDLLSNLFNNAFHHALADGWLRFLFKREKIPEAINTQDFIGINYYTRDLVSFALSPAEMFTKRSSPIDTELSETGFIANIPSGLHEALKWAIQYNLPIYITENGVDDSKDTLRPRYLIEHIHQIWRVINNNWPVKGYFHWTLVDNFEWERGWTQRFGLWGLDPYTQKRRRRPSVDVYEAICKENGISSDMVNKYTPQIFGKLFPG